MTIIMSFRFQGGEDEERRVKHKICMGEVERSVNRVGRVLE